MGRIYNVTCRCGTEFITLRPNIRWCVKCVKAKRNKIRRASEWMHPRRKENFVYAEGSHTQAEWWEVLKRQHFLCYYCDVDLTRKNWNRDHKIPVCRGGSDDISNIVAACKRCNMDKGKKTDTEYFKVIKTRALVRRQKAVENTTKSIGLQDITARNSL